MLRAVFHPFEWKRSLARGAEIKNHSWKSFAILYVIKYVAPFVNLPRGFLDYHMSLVDSRNKMRYYRHEPDKGSLTFSR